MRDDEIRRVLSAANPWWVSAAGGADVVAWTSSHRLLRDRGEYDLGYRADVLDDIAAGSPDGSLVVLTGPRRIGKSVALLDAIAALCRCSDVDPRQIIHVPCDGMRDRDLRRVITLGRALTRSVDLQHPVRRVWFFDEISAIPGWTSVLKAARDSTEFGDDTVVATGSRWASNEDVHGNLLAGRAGRSNGHRIRQLLPMTFRDYLAATRPELPMIPAEHPGNLQSQEARETLHSVEFAVDDYDLAWQDYLTCGGFPRAVAEHAKTGAVSNPYVRDLLAWLRADIDPDAANDSVPRLLAGIAGRMTSPLNLTRTSQDLGYSNRPVLERRVTRLINSHAALWCQQRADRGDLVVGAQHKLYLTDPILAWAPSLASPGLPEPDMTALNEATLAVALARRIDELDEGRWVAEDTIGYARTASGNEIDFAPVRVPNSAGPTLTTPIESKWIDAGWRSEVKTMGGKYGRGILATKSILDIDDSIWAVPSPLLALLLNGERP